MLLRIRHIPSLNSHVPKFVSCDPDFRIITVRQPVFHWIPLHLRARIANIDIFTLLDLKQELQSHVRQLYAHGIEYRVKPNCVFLARTFSAWTLYLGGWEHCDLRQQVTPSEWETKMTAQLAEVDDLFAPLEARFRDAVDVTEAIAAVNTLSLGDCQDAE